MDLNDKSVPTTSREPSNGTAAVLTPAGSSSNIVVGSSSSILINSNSKGSAGSEKQRRLFISPNLNFNSTSVSQSATSTSTSKSTSTSTFKCATSSNYTDMCSCDNQNATLSSASCTSNKRKRRLTSDSNDDTKDPELGFEPPSAKRQQRLPAIYGSDQSNLSSVYTSPVVSADGQNNQEVLSIRSSPAEEFPESSHSPLPDSPDSPPLADRGNKVSPVAVRYIRDNVTSSSTLTIDSDEHEHEHDDDDDDEHDDDEEDDALDSCEDYSLEEEEDDDEEEINSSSISSTSSNGERTPAPPQQPQCSSSLRSTPKMPKMPKMRNMDEYAMCMSPAIENTVRQCPLPALAWANAGDVWKLMCLRDEQDSRLRSVTMLDQHPGLQPRMRAILLDWLIEVCEVYKLHRETFYLAVDYLDRYLYKANTVQKTHLQLIGITCLFVAAKVEEIYPPKIGEFAYVTDGACTEIDILEYEKYLLQCLDWEISPLTVTGWLGVYMQLNINNRTPASFSQIGKQAANDGGMGAAVAADDAFIYPQFSGFEFVQTSQLLDLCALDVGMANFSYSTLAAAAISHTFNRDTALRCSGLDWQAIQPCALWMEPFFQVISKNSAFIHANEQNEQVANKFGLAHVCPNIVTDDSHIIQSHTTTMDMYDEVLMIQNALHALHARTQASPATALRAPVNLLTPPASSHKPDEYLCDEDGELVTGGTACQSNSSLANRENIALSNH